jgi:RNA polymerase sigma-70 factor (ECF subfamily)
MTATAVRRNAPLTASKTRRGKQKWTEIQDATAEIVAAAQRGDRDAQRELYELSHQNVYRLMVRMVGLQDADDLTQQVFLQAFRKMDQFSGRSLFSTWLYRLAVNESLQHLRRSKRAQPHVLQYEPMDNSPGHIDSVEQKDLLERALAKLEPDLRSTFLLREVEELSYGEIALALDIPEGTVGSRLNRARRELKQHLVELGWEP